MMIRARTVEGMKEAGTMFDHCLRAGALGIGAQLEVETVGGYRPNTTDIADVDFLNRDLVEGH